MNSVPQLLANALVSGASIALVGVSFGLIYRVCRFFHFAHAAVFVSGAYVTYFLITSVSISIAASFPLAVISCSGLGCIIEISIYQPLRRRGSSSLVLLLSSLGVYIVLQNIISLLFGDDAKSLLPNTVAQGIEIGGARITAVQIAMIISSLAIVTIVTVFLRKTEIGRQMRAVASDPELAGASGIESRRVYRWAFTLGSLLAAIAGILCAMDAGVTPTMGMNALMLGVVAVIVGGVGSIPGIALASLLLGLAQHVTAWNIGSMWQDVIAFCVLLLFLLVRPQGFWGKRIRKVTI